MKRNKLLLLAGAISLAGIFTSCSDEDPLYWAGELNQDFGSMLFSNATLNLTYGGEPLTGKEVGFHTDNSKTATLTLTDVIPGETETVISDVVLTAADDVYNLYGQTTTANGSLVKVSGTVSPKNLSVNFDVALSDPKGWAQTYTFSDYSMDEKKSKIVSSAVYIGLPESLPDDDGSLGLLQGLGAGIGSYVLPQMLGSITLAGDGNIVAGISSDTLRGMDMSSIFAMLFLGDGPTPEVMAPLLKDRTYASSPKNLAYWYAKGDHLYLKLNLPAILQQTMKGIDEKLVTGIAGAILKLDPTMLRSLLVTLNGSLNNEILGVLTAMDDATFRMFFSWLTEGIPMNVSVTESGHTRIYLDYATLTPVINMLPDLIPIIAPVIPEEYQMLTDMLKAIPSVWGNTDKFDLGLELIAQ